MSASRIRRRASVIVFAGALIALGLLGATEASAATYYACVKKNGTARIYTKKPKCHKHESKITWNSEGPAGKNGLNGLNGTNGANGSPGANLTAETPLPSGQSESGTFSAGGGVDKGWEVGGKKYFGYVGAGLTFTQPLSTRIEEEHIKDVRSSKEFSKECPGPGQAARGYLCLYNFVSNDVHPGYGYSNSEDESAPEPGVFLYWEVLAEGEPWVGGEYTVTAP